MFDRTDSSTLSRLEPHVAAILRALYQVGEASNVGPLKGLAGVGSLVLEKCMVGHLLSSRVQATILKGS